MDKLEGDEGFQKEIICAFCNERLPCSTFFCGTLPCCHHHYCKQCIGIVQRTGVDKPFPCPVCRKKVCLPHAQREVDQLDQPKTTSFTNRVKEVHSKLEQIYEAEDKCKVCAEGDNQPQSTSFANRIKEVHSKLEQIYSEAEDKCEMCAGGRASAFCRQCAQFICEKCVESHRRMKIFASHNTLYLDDLRGGGVKEIIMPKASHQTASHQHQTSCKIHAEPMTIFCFDCNSLICRDCIIKDHSGHNCDLINVAAPDIKKKLIEQLEHLREIKQSLSQAVKKVKNTKCEIEAQGRSVAEEIESSFEELVEIIIKRKQELLKEAAMEVTNKLESLCVQEKNLSTSYSLLDSFIKHTEQCVERSADDKMVCMHVELESEIAREINEEHKNLEPVEVADLVVEVNCFNELAQLCQTKAKVTQLHVDPKKCIVIGEGARYAEMNQDSFFLVETNVKSKGITKQKCAVECRLISLMTGSVTRCKVYKMKGGEYHIQYTPTVHGDHELIVTVNGEAVVGSPFPVCVSIDPTQLGQSVKTFSGLNKPYDVAVNSEGDVIVTEHHGDVVMFDRDGRRLRSIKRSDHGFKYLNGVAVDREDNIYFIDGQTNCIIYKANKKMKIIQSKRSKYPSKNRAAHIAVVGDEVMLSALNDLTTIEVYNTDLEYVREITPCNIGPRTVSFRGISSDEHGTLYVSDSENNCIQVLSNDGKFLHSIACDKLSIPSGLCVAGQYVYVAEWGARKTSVYTIDGEHVTSFRHGVRKKDKPLGVCVDRHGLVYVCDYENNRVQIF